MNYFKKKWKYYISCIIMFFSFNLYFIFLMRDRHIQYLLYLDFLLLVFFLLFTGIDCFTFKKMEKEKQFLLQKDDMISCLLSEFENKDIAEHDVQILNKQLQQAFNENCELQDYVAKVCHELKIPLAASLLIDENIRDIEIKKAMQEQLEKMNQQMNSMLLGCKLQSALFDLQIRKILLLDCVKTSVRNNQFFLIRKNFELDVQVGDLYVYTDPAWLVYILDQLLNNAIKYARENPMICIWAEQKKDSVQLFIEDHGEGIKDSDITRIFEKGFTGSNYHNGRYKSTGMGLYMVSKIVSRLEHEILVESEFGSYTRFCIVFKENRYFCF